MNHVMLWCLASQHHMFHISAPHPYPPPPILTPTTRHPHPHYPPPSPPLPATLTPTTHHPHIHPLPPHPPTTSTSTHQPHIQPPPPPHPYTHHAHKSDGADNHRILVSCDVYWRGSITCPLLTFCFVCLCGLNPRHPQPINPPQTDTTKDKHRDY